MYVKAVSNCAGPDFEPIAAGAVGLVPDERGAALIKGGFAEAAEEPERGPAPPPLSDTEVRRLRNLVGGA